MSQKLDEYVAEPEKTAKAERAFSGASWSDADLETYLREHGVVIHHGPYAHNGGMQWDVDCPRISEHTKANGYNAAVYRDGAAVIGYKCFGERCADITWQRLREFLEPDRHSPECSGPGAKRLSAVTPRTELAPLRLVKATDVAKRAVEFMWDKRIVLHALNLNVGDEDAGKGLLDCWLAAELTTGRMLGRLASVAYITTEEDVETIVRPRLEAAGANLEMVRLLPMAQSASRIAYRISPANYRRRTSRWRSLTPSTPTSRPTTTSTTHRT